MLRHHLRHYFLGAIQFATSVQSMSDFSSSRAKSACFSQPLFSDWVTMLWPSSDERITVSMGRSFRQVPRLRSVSSTPVRTTWVTSSAYTLGSICFFHWPVLPVYFLPRNTTRPSLNTNSSYTGQVPLQAPPATATNLSPGFHSGMPPDSDPAA